MYQILESYFIQNALGKKITKNGDSTLHMIVYFSNGQIWKIVSIYSCITANVLGVMEDV